MWTRWRAVVKQSLQRKQGAVVFDENEDSEIAGLPPGRRNWWKVQKRISPLDANHAIMSAPPGSTGVPGRPGRAVYQRTPEAAGRSDERLLVLLTCLLAPLVESQNGPTGKEKGQLGWVTLSILLSVIELVRSCAPHMKGLGGPVSQGDASVQQQTAARRVKQLTASLRDTSNREELQLWLSDLCKVIEGDQLAVGAVIDAPGGIGILVELCQPSSTIKSRTQAVGVVRKCADLDEANRTAIGKAGGIRPLVKLLNDTKVKPELRAEAAAALAGLAR